MTPPPLASAFCGSGGKNAKRKGESVNLQLLKLLLLELLRETRCGARRGAGEHTFAEATKQTFDEDARNHAETDSTNADG
jgi:hypothetical protein